MPNLDVSLLEKSVAIPSWTKARKTFRVALAKKASPWKT